MTHRQHERLDETIDRVAAQLTMVPADPALAGRIAAQLDRETPSAWPLLAVIAAAAAIVIGFAIFNSAPHVPTIDVAHRATPPADAAPAGRRSDAPAPTDESIRAAAAASSTRADATHVAPAEEPLPEMPQLESLTSPSAIELAMLPTDTLSIDPVDLAPLDMPDLAVRGIDDGESPRE